MPNNPEYYIQELVRELEFVGYQRTAAEVLRRYNAGDGLPDINWHLINKGIDALANQIRNITISKGNP